MASFMFAGTWGGLLWIFFPDWGWKVGVVLFMPCFVVLYNLGRRPNAEEDEYAKEYYE
jgi:membrane protein implicated in regulation of membrane protease activity